MHLHILRTQGAALRRRASIAVLLATGVFTTVRAVTVTWDGGASTGAWATGTNWSTNSVPANADLLVFDANAANSQFSITLGSNRTAAGITFSSTGASGFTFDAANSLTLNAGGLTSNNSNTQTFNGTVIVNAAQAWNAASGGFTAAGAVTLLNTLTLSGSGAQAFNGTITNSGGNRTITNNSTGTVTFGAIALSQNNIARTLTFAGSGAATVTGIIGNGGSGDGGLTYGGTGSLTLSGNNTYTGVTTISSGTVRATTSANALGTGIATVSMGGGTLQLANDSALNYARNTTLTGSANITSDRLTTGAGLTHTLGTLAIGASTLTVSAGSLVKSNTAYGLTFGATTLSVSGAVFDVAKNGTADGTLTLGALSGNFNFTKQGAGSLVLDTASTRSAGSATVTAGTLTLGSVSGLGTTGATIILGGGILNLATDSTVNAYNTTVSGNSSILSNKATAASAGITQTLGTLSINGSTLSVGPGANVSGAYGVTFGATTLSASGAVFSVANNGTLTLGALADGGIARTVTKGGAGVLTVDSAATSLVNGTAVNITAGTLNSNNATALGSLANVTLLSAGAKLGVGATQTVGALNGTAGTAILGANTLTIGGTNNLTSSFGGAITGTGGITKAGTGDLTLSGTNLYSGTTLISAGTLFAQGSAALGATTGVTTVGSGGTLSLLGGTVMTKSSTLSLTGAGATGSLGALVAGGASGQTSEWLGNISLAGNATIGAPSSLLIVGEGTTFTNTIALGANTLTFNTSGTPSVTPTYVTSSYLLDPSNIVVNSAISGTGGIIKTGTGTVTLMPVASGGSTFTGNTVITGGKLILDSQSNMPAINSTQIYVGNSSSPGSADSVVLQMGQLASPPSSNNIVGTYNSGTNASASNLTVYADGLFNMNGASNGFINLTLQGGHVSGGTASYSPLLTLTGNVTTNAAGTTALIDNGFVGMSANSFAFNVATGTTTSGTDLQIGSVLQNGVGYTGGTSGTSLSKTGTGKMALTAANTFSGITNITAGILNIQNGAALGQVSSSLGSTTNGTVVSAGAQLQLQGGITVGIETLTLNGTGITTDGALRNLSGNNTYNGFVYLGTSSRINADSGTTLSITNTNGVNGTILNGLTAGQNLTVGGAGDTVINGGIGANITNITKADAGTLTLAGTNGYAGTTTVSTGAVKLTNSNALSGTGVTVTSGAALQFAQDATSANISVVGVASTISGTGLSNGGAIQNLTGANSYAGPITLAANSRITANSGSSLTMSGNVNVATFALDARGAGNTTYSGVISGTGSLTKSDAGIATLAGSSANTFSGGVTVDGGTLELNKTGVGATGTGNVTVNSGGTLKLLQSNQISDTSTVTVNGTGTFNLNGLNETIGSFAGTGTIDTGSATLITGGDNTSTSFGGVLAGNGVIQKVGTGTLTFNASMSYTGEINLAGGTISLAGLAGANVNFTVGTLRITGNTVLDFGLSSASVLTATNVILENGATLTITGWVDTQDFFYATNTFGGLVGVTYTPVTPDVRGVAPQNQITFTGFTGNSTIWQSYDRQITPAPEPATYGAIFLGCCLGLLGWRRYGRRQVSVG